MSESNFYKSVQYNIICTHQRVAHLHMTSLCICIHMLLPCLCFQLANSVMPECEDLGTPPRKKPRLFTVKVRCTIVSLMSIKFNSDPHSCCFDADESVKKLHL